MAGALSTDRIALGSGRLVAEISPVGAELCSVQCDGAEWLWPGDPARWPRQAPVLFPHCGRTRNRTIRIDGHVWPDQPIHGFAPTSRFAIAFRSPERVTLRLDDTPATRALFPFSFRLDVTFTLTGGELVQEILCENRDRRPMPVGAGFHPGFAWPLPGGGAKDAHIIRFAADEPAPIALPDADGLMGGATMPSRVRDRVLQLDDTLFQAGSAIFTDLRSRALWFGVPGRAGLAMRFSTPYLVLWRWPGPGTADYLCIEPWAGLPDPAGFAGELSTKPGVALLAPGETRRWRMGLRPGA